MNKELWDKILQFDLDNLPGEYGFPARLAKENYWTKNFTEQAILEYKKFMYLAATSEFMVSPSKIVDTVWHQHLIFTQSYQDFCDLMGKPVQHIPSTHNEEEFDKFRQAKERTKKLYQNNFRGQPKGIWAYNDMYGSLNLDKAKFKLRTFIIIGILSFLLLTIPFYFLLRPLYVTIDNPYFIFGFIGLTIVTFLGLDSFNHYWLKRISDQFDKNSFIYHLHPLELVYLQTQKISNVINGTLNELINKGSIQIKADNTIELFKQVKITSPEQLQTINSLNNLGRTIYPTLMGQLITKPVFANTANCMDAFKKYFNKSKKFGNLFYINFSILSILLMLGFIRLMTGILRDKPIMQLAITLFVLTVLIIKHLNRLTKIVCTITIPDLYKNEILTTKQVQENWQWSYFLLGTAALSPSFVPLLVNPVDKTNNSGNSSGTSCGSSCGSSCSSCGGCGGD